MDETLSNKTQHYDGVQCWMGSLIYPYWLIGNDYGAVWDVESAHLERINADCLDISVRSYVVKFGQSQDAECLSDEQVLYLRKDRRNGAIYYSYQLSLWTYAQCCRAKDTSETARRFRQAYALLWDWLEL